MLLYSAAHLSTNGGMQQWPRGCHHPCNERRRPWDTTGAERQQRLVRAGHRYGKLLLLTRTKRSVMIASSCAPLPAWAPLPCCAEPSAQVHAPASVSIRPLATFHKLLAVSFRHWLRFWGACRCSLRCSSHSAVLLRAHRSYGGAADSVHQRQPRSPSSSGNAAAAAAGRQHAGAAADHALRSLHPVCQVPGAGQRLHPGALVKIHRVQDLLSAACLSLASPLD